ncbi:MAG: lamin tail domain-containing protein [Verrucomicrobiales bacterium]
MRSIYRAGEDVTVFSNKNWYAGRRARGSSPDGFRLFTWDGEMSMGNHLMFNLAGVDVAQRVTDLDLTRANSAGSPVAIYDALRRNTEFKVRFGDRLQKHFFNGGAMTPAANAARWAAMEDEIEGAIIGESARWGDEGGITFTRDGNWRPEVAWVQNTFIAGRNATVLNQFRAVGLYPPIDAPSFSQHGGEIPDDGSFSLAITGPAASTIYYTTDGSDPYDPPLSISTQLIGENAPVTALVPTTANGGSALGSRWYFLGEPSNSANWKSGTNGVGYETAPADYADLINTDVSEMYTSNGSVYIRILFEIPDQETLDAFDKLTLSMRYDDGFAAYLNTRLVANKNAPLTPAYNSVATANHPDSDAVIYESFDISSNLFALRVGSNILAIQGMNDGTDSSDLLIQARLEASADISPGGPSANAVEYTGAIPLAQSGAVRARALSQDGDWSALTEAQFIYGTPASAANLVVSELSYRPLGATTLAEIASGATDRGAFEFIEVMNVSAERIDLTGVAFSAGIVFDFTGSNATSLDPGGRALVVANLAAFTARYGAAAAALVAGEFGDLTNLDNGGELVALNAADGSAIQSFTYDDRAPWPESPDGEGFSLVLIDPMSLPDHGDPASWRASLDLGGTPGGDSLADYESWARRYFDPDSPSFAARSAPGNDDDGDGIVNLWEKILATNPTVPNSSGIAGGVIEDAGESFLMIEATVRAGASANLFGEGSENLAQWSDADATLVDIVPRPSAATETVRYRLIAPMESGGGFLRFGASE